METIIFLLVCYCDRQHYNVNMTSIEVGGKILELPLSLFQTKMNRGTVIDSGTTLAYLPDIAYSRLMEQV